MGETLLPESFACLFVPQQTFGNPLRTFGQSFASRFSKIKIFSGTAKFSSLYAGTSRVPPRVLAVWAKTLRGQLLLLIVVVIFIGYYCYFYFHGASGSVYLSHRARSPVEIIITGLGLGMAGGACGLAGGRARFWGALATWVRGWQPQPPGSWAPKFHATEALTKYKT